MIDRSGESKKDLRERMLSLRRQQAPEKIQRKSAEVTGRIVSLAEFKDAHRVLIYLAMPEEVQTHDLAEHALGQGKEVLIPVVTGDRDLQIAVLPDRNEAWETGPFGIRQPVLEHAQLVSADALDAVLAPGVGFDRQGRRIGFGKGYFDRLFFKTRPDCHRIGLAFDYQIVDEVPVDSTDAPLDLIVTNLETIRCAR